MNEKLMKSLAGVSVTELESLLKEKRQEAYQPLITEYETTETKLNELRNKIRLVNPEWAPMTNADRVAKFIGDKKGGVLEADIIAAFKDVIGNSWLVKNILKKGVEGNRWTVKEQKYSLV